MQDSKLKKRFCFCDSGDTYRVKFRLSDGRHVYARDGDSFTIVDKEWLPKLEQFVCSWAYDLSLRIFSPKQFFETARRKHLVIIETIPELANSPLDPRAFVLGGMLAVDFANLNGNSFAA